ncbi:hypothetical protein [Anaerobranca gottschalkii]|uniref:Lipoprotein n=1 Tax=Anaerobranca gottschalkii DSM 13577 TaxID=1120990 RepID=A0A1H9YIY1_9FIRM|nr:hypothetical protein [Anaerobranca gottschalkii]SES68903.1 hypothetical protein SAMN03080614_100355 [Anaerobranca gottschalkii DSM 13577]
MLKLKKEIISIVVIALLILTITGCKSVVKVHIIYPLYDDLDSMILSADTIVEGKILSMTVVGSEQEGVLYTVYDVEIITNFKGKFNSKEVIKIKQVGGETKDLVVTTDERVNLKKDLTYLLFLVTYEDSPASLINPTQGAYLLEDGKYIEHNDNKIKINREILKQRIKEIGN